VNPPPYIRTSAIVQRCSARRGWTFGGRAGHGRAHPGERRILTADQDPEPARRTACAERYSNLNARHAAWFGLSMWIAAIACLALFARGDFLGPMNFTLLESWFIGAGCVGVPILAARLLGRWLTPAACMAGGAACAACTILLTVLFATGQLRAPVIVAAFWLILPEALAIHLVNAADSMTRTDSAVAAALEQARSERDRDVQGAFAAGLLAAHDALTEKGEVAEQVEELLDSSTEEIAAMSERLLRELDGRRVRDARPGHGLRLVRDADELVRQQRRAPPGPAHG
jgi:hypothetical protein